MLNKSCRIPVSEGITDRANSPIQVVTVRQDCLQLDTEQSE